MPILNFITYSGMPFVPVEGTMGELRARAARRIRKARRQGQPVSVVEPGREWEFETPDDAFMISDQDGYLVIRDDPPQEDSDDE